MVTLPSLILCLYRLFEKYLFTLLMLQTSIFQILQKRMATLKLTNVKTKISTKSGQSKPRKSSIICDCITKPFSSDDGHNLEIVFFSYVYFLRTFVTYETKLQQVEKKQTKTMNIQLARNCRLVYCETNFTAWSYQILFLQHSVNQSAAFLKMIRIILAGKTARLILAFC